MKRTIVLWFLVIAWLPICVGASEGSWWRMMEANRQLDFLTARDEALATVAQNHDPAQVLAAVAWWKKHLEILSRPEEILSADPAVSDPELTFLLAQIEAELHGDVPKGALPQVSVSGPFGVLDNLDLERGAAPPDHQMPPLPTVFEGYGTAFNVPFSRNDAWGGPPEQMIQGGRVGVELDHRCFRRQARVAGSRGGR